MARKPNYDFERKERERLKKQRNEERAAAKLKPLSQESVADGENSAPAGEDGQMVRSGWPDRGITVVANRRPR